VTHNQTQRFLIMSSSFAVATVSGARTRRQGRAREEARDDAREVVGR
jgi:hypothetical protein